MFFSASMRSAIIGSVSISRSWLTVSYSASTAALTFIPKVLCDKSGASKVIFFIPKGVILAAKLFKLSDKCKFLRLFLHFITKSSIFAAPIECELVIKTPLHAAFLHNPLRPFFEHDGYELSCGQTCGRWRCCGQPSRDTCRWRAVTGQPTANGNLAASLSAHLWFPAYFCLGMASRHAYLLASHATASWHSTSHL